MKNIASQAHPHEQKQNRMEKYLSNLHLQAQKYMHHHRHHHTIAKFHNNSNVFLSQGKLCENCSESGPNLWICLHKQCMHIGCSDKHNDHSTIHFEVRNLNPYLSLYFFVKR